VGVLKGGRGIMWTQQAGWLAQTDERDIRWLATDLTEEEKRFWLTWYVTLTNVQRIAIDCVIDTGDLRLVLYLWEDLVEHTKQCHETFLA
jgi:hypothetical protein